MEHLFGFFHDVFWGAVVFFSAVQIKNGLYTLASGLGAIAQSNVVKNKGKDNANG